MLLLYSLALFLSAVLLFVLEPMVGKMLLPQCGGTPAVWNTCMVFFQTALLLGYLYAHLSTSLLGVRRQAAFHLIVLLLPLLALPTLFDTGVGPPQNRNPSLWLLVQLTMVVGLPFFVVSTSAPLLQRWFANTGHAQSGDPYFLYSVSNAGSLLALLSYPFLIEPNLGLITQTRVWTAGYIVLIFLIFSSALAMWLSSRRAQLPALTPQNPDCRPAPESQTHDHQSSAPEVRLQQRIDWVFLAFIPSSLMLGVTSHIATDIASVPLLWVIPLVLYLLTFVIVFARKPVLPHRLVVAAMPYAVLLMPLFGFRIPMKFWATVPVHLLTFFIVAMVCHGELARSRPESKRLTEFYLWMSLGGVFGGVFNSLVAPMLFTSVIEYPLVLVAACLFIPPRKASEKRLLFTRNDAIWLAGLVAAALLMVEIVFRIPSPNALLVGGLVYGVPAVICFTLRGRPIRFALGLAALFLTVAYFVGSQSGDVILATRDFYGVNRVRITGDRSNNAKFNALINGNVIHGLQEMYPVPRNEPLGYYSRTGPLGDLACAFDQSKPRRSVAVIGLGTGSIAAYAARDQQYTFYEIDPTVIRIAGNPDCFTYLKQCKGRCRVIAGDARIQIAAAPDAAYDTIILDAFSSDSIPMHLLTQEALQLYCRKLKKDGVLVLHITNRYLNLEPVLAALAGNNGLVCLSRADLQLTPAERQKGKYPSRYLVMARKLSDLGDLPQNPKWQKAARLDGIRPWTDDYSNIFSVLCW